MSLEDMFWRVVGQSECRMLESCLKFLMKRVWTLLDMFCMEEVRLGGVLDCSSESLIKYGVWKCIVVPTCLYTVTPLMKTTGER